MGKFRVFTKELKASIEKDKKSKTKVLEELVSNPELSSLLTPEQKLEVKKKILQKTKRPIGHVSSVQRNWFGEEYKKERRKKIESYKAKTWLEKLYDEIELEIDNELFDCRMEADIHSEDEARLLCIKRQLIKMNRPLTFCEKK